MMIYRGRKMKNNCPVCNSITDEVRMFDIKRIFNEYLSDENPSGDSDFPNVIDG